jgi:5-methylcytosine-specific restriction endonuclease McrA
MSISKSLRFKIFKRDGFGCQYCGRRSSDGVAEELCP